MRYIYAKEAREIVNSINVHQSQEDGIKNTIMRGIESAARKGFQGLTFNRLLATEDIDNPLLFVEWLSSLGYQVSLNQKNILKITW